MNPHGRTMTGPETAELLAGCAGVAAGLEPLGAAVLEQLPELKVISRCGVGVDNVDLAYAEAHGIKVYATKDAPSQAVAELVLGYALNLFRRVSEMDRKLRGGEWKKLMGSLVAGKKVGIVGYGNIGRKAAKLFAAVGCAVAFYDPFAKEADIPGMGLDALLQWCDCLTLHAPKTADGKALLGARELALLRPGALLINAARGGMVDEDALYEALKVGRLGGAALDVFESEPYSGPLTRLDNVILTPHIGSYAKEARIRMELETVENLLAELGPWSSSPLKR
jgi:D-3-phosphoglycerate dehydrogenase